MDIKEIIKDSVKIEKIAEDLGLQLSRHTSGLHGQCPTGHESKSGTCFSVNTRDNYFYCFNCGIGGDNIKLVEIVKGFKFQDALKWMVERYRPDLLTYIDKYKKKRSPQDEIYYQKAGLYEKIFEYGKELLYKSSSKNVLKYLTEKRGYNLDNLKKTEWIYWPSDREIRKYLLSKYPKSKINIEKLKLQGYFGDNFRLAFPYRDRRGAITGFFKRALSGKGIDIQTYDGKEYEGVRWDSTSGLKKDDLFNIYNCRNYKSVIVVEGCPDSMYLKSLGIKNVVAVGQGILSRNHIKCLQAFNIQDVTLCFDNDEPKENGLRTGVENTAKALKILGDAGIDAYVIDPLLLAPHKDPDELVREHGKDVFENILEKAERGSSWMVGYTFLKHNLDSDRGMDCAINESLEIWANIDDGIEKKFFWSKLKEISKFTDEELAVRIQKLADEASKRKIKQAFIRLLNDVRGKVDDEDLPAAEEAVSLGLQKIRESRGVVIPEPYLIGDLEEDLLSTTEGLKTGYNAMDEILNIPQGAITIIGGRPGHGKTTFKLNLLVNMLQLYPDLKFYFFSYEEARKYIGLKMIMIKSGVILNDSFNQNAYKNYFKEKRGFDYRIEDAISWYDELTSSNRLTISDIRLSGEDLVTTIGYLNKKKDTGAVFIDYIQKIPLKDLRESQRYMQLKKVSELLLEMAVAQDIPIILGAQLNRQGNSDIKLEHIRECGDIEQDSNLVLGIYNESVSRTEEANEENPDDLKVNLKVSVLKNRGGFAGKKVPLVFNRPVLKIMDTMSRNRYY